MKRTKNYIGTFQNTNEGITQYKTVLNTIRMLNIQDRVCKKFRGEHRPSYSYNHPKTNATHFDVYIYKKNR